MRRARAYVLPVLLAAACARSGEAPAPPLPAAEVNRTFELRFTLPAGVDPAAVRAELRAPSGRRLETGTFPLGPGHAARVRPREAGRHAWTIRAGDRVVAEGALVAEDRGAAGQVIVRDGALFLEDGTPFHPLGENRFNVYDPAWSDGLSASEYVARMAADGMNTLRVFVFTACGGAGAAPQPGCLEPRLGAFDPVAAARYDEVFAAAERHGVKVIPALFAVGFTPGDAWKGWELNPYSAARGGPAADPEAFFASAEAREAAKARLRYVLARWGASPALLSVDLLNEPEWDGALEEEWWIPWAEDLAATWRAEDPYGHPITAGPVGLHWNVVTDERAWWSSPACDVVQFHRYGPDVYDVHALAAELDDVITDLRRYEKPVLLGEFGWGADPKPLHDHTHVGIWAATFAGGGALAHSAPVFTIDSDEPMTPARAAHFRVLAAFLRRAGRAGPLAPVADPVAIGPAARAQALGAGAARAVWLLGPKAGYGARVEGVRLAFPDLAPGTYRVTWIDDVTGEVVRDAIAPLGGEATVEAPAFTRHLAAIVTPR